MASISISLSCALLVCGFGCGTPSAPASSVPPVSSAPIAPSASAQTASAPVSSAPAASAKPDQAAAATPAPISEVAKRVVEAQDRSADDRALDAGRHPGEMLTFFGIAPGQRVGEIVAGAGYTTELLARTVGAQGKVYAQNNRFILEKFAQKPWAARLAKPENKNVVRVDRELEEPFPADVKDLDCVIDVLFYHDTVWMKTDRAKMNRAIFAALKPGGVYGIVDHSGRDGTSTRESDTLHRIEEKVVREEIVAAGFVLEAQADFLRNPKDTRDWNASPRAAAEKRGTSDRFVLKFVKPAKK
jgi:predicted methyltransferase